MDIGRKRAQDVNSAERLELRMYVNSAERGLRM